MTSYPQWSNRVFFLDLLDMPHQLLFAAWKRTGLYGPHVTGFTTHPNMYSCLPELFA